MTGESGSTDGVTGSNVPSYSCKNKYEHYIFVEKLESHRNEKNQTRVHHYDLPNRGVPTIQFFMRYSTRCHMFSEVPNGGCLRFRGKIIAIGTNCMAFDIHLHCIPAMPSLVPKRQYQPWGEVDG